MGLTRTALERPSASTAPVFADNEESCLQSQPGTQLVLSSSSGPHSLGHGVLYITSKRVVWQHGSRDSCTYAVEYRQLLMHAISRGSDDLPQPAIYCQLEQGDEEYEEDEEPDADEEARGEEEEEVNRAAEVRFVPDDAEAVDVMYAALCQGAALNPDPVQEGEGDFFFDQESLQVAPGVNVHSLLTQTAAAAAGMEHVGEEYDVDDDDDEEDDGDGEEQQEGGGERPTAGLEVVGHRVPVSAGSHSSSAAMEQTETEATAEDEAVIAEHRDD